MLDIAYRDFCGIIMDTSQIPAEAWQKSAWPKEGENTMKVLITITQNPAQRYLVRLFHKDLIDEVRNLVSSNRHYEAIATALSKGRLDRTVREDEIHSIGADLILSETSASWDLVK